MMGSPTGRRTTLVLVALAAFALLAAWQFGVPSERGGQKLVVPGTLVFPGLAARLQSAERVTIQSKGATLTLARKDGIWGIAERGGYRAQQDRLRELLTGLTELRITEPRTSDPEQHGRLGVDDPTKPASTANLVRVLAADGAAMAELIVGHRRVRTAGNVPETLYIRRPGEAQSWLAEGRMPVDADPQLWFEREITNIPQSRITSVVSQRGDAILEFGRKDGKPVLMAPAEHPVLDEYRVEDVFRALESLTLTDVKPGAEQPGSKVGSAVFTTTEGLVVTVTVFRADTDVWAQFAVSGEGAATQEADGLAGRIRGWAYQVGSWKEKSFAPSLDELKAEEAEPRPAPAEAKPAP